MPRGKQDLSEGFANGRTRERGQSGAVCGAFGARRGVAKASGRSWKRRVDRTTAPLPPLWVQSAAAGHLWQALIIVFAPCRGSHLSV